MDTFIGSFHSEDILNRLSHPPAPQSRMHGRLYASGACSVHASHGRHIALFGEVYNIAAIAEEQGFIFASAAQSFLELFIRDIRLIKKLDGEFTAIIFADDRCSIIRDRHGASLQVYYTGDLFCSNVFDLKKSRDFTPEMDRSSLATFLAYGYVPAPRTALKGIAKLAPGSLLEWKQGKATVSSLYSFEEFSSSVDKSIRMEDAAAELERLHRQSIQQRIRGKNSIGLLVSGGYDSGGNLHALRQLYNGRISTFSVGFKDNPLSELPLAQKLAEAYSTDHTVYELDGSEIASLPDAVAALGDPFQENGLMVNYVVQRMVAKNRPEILLGGDGNDQLYGVALRELAIFFLISRMGLMPALRAASSLLQANIFDRDNFLFKFRFQGHKISHILENDRFGLNGPQQASLLRDTVPYTAPSSPVQSCSTFDELCLVKQYYVDLAQIVNEVIVFKASRIAALFGNQLSFPYLSTDIYDFLKTLPRELKARGDLKTLVRGRGSAKYLHKQYLQNCLPREITHRKKQGGFAPLAIFFRDLHQRKNLFAYIRGSRFVAEFAHADRVEQFLRRYDAAVDTTPYWFWNRQTKTNQLCNLLVICIWWEMMKGDAARVPVIT